MTPKEITDAILKDPDFINSPKHDNSLKKFSEAHDEGVKDSYIEKLLMLLPGQVDQIYKDAVMKLRELMGEGRSE